MKTSVPAILLCTATAARACVTAHVYFSSCVFDIASGINHMVVQLWDNGVEVCRVGKGDPKGSQNTPYEMDCGNGAKVVAYGYGAKLDYTSADGYFVSMMSNDGTGPAKSNCGTVGDGHTVHGTLAEHVFADQYCEKCNTAKLCDGKSYCPDFDPACHF